MNKYLKIFIVVFSAVILANVLSSGIFSYIYMSETDKAIKRSNEQIAHYNKANAERIKNVNQAIHEQYKNTEREMSLSLQQQQYNNKNSAYNYNLTNQRNAARRLKDKEEREERNRIYKEKQKLKREKERIKSKNDAADRAHIRNENMKTCKFWTQEYKNKPTAKNNTMKKTACERAYNRSYY